MTRALHGPELRKDPVTGRWVIIATERAKRPAQFQRVEEERKGGFCPFCPGNERTTPPEVLSYRTSSSTRDNEGWWLRVVPNKFPALTQENALKRSAEGMYDRITGYGVHEVLIESPHHEHTIADLSPFQIQEVIWALRDRIVEIRKDTRMKYVMIFKNWGSEAGASLEHPHIQIIGLPIVPKRVTEELSGASKYFEYKERCVFCDMLQQELANGSRIITENQFFVAFMPFAARFPFETWIMPREHAAFFHDIQKNQVGELGEILKSVTSLLKDALEDPPYNLVIHTTPFDEQDSVASYHWHIELMPKLTKVAGFERGTGFYINPTPPEAAAEFLHEVVRRVADATAPRSDTAPQIGP